MLMIDNKPKEKGPVLDDLSEGLLAATRDNIKFMIISYLGFNDPASNATNKFIADTVDESFKRIGVELP